MQSHATRQRSGDLTQRQARQGNRPATVAGPQQDRLTRLAAQLDARAYGLSRPAVQHRPNHTGLPDALKQGMESLSGLSLDGVRVHHNSAEPARFQAHAITQGKSIHVAPGQHHHLPHELGHVVQQMQGRVRPTARMHGMPVNDDPALEAEADRLGIQALQRRASGRVAPTGNMSSAVLQRVKNEKKRQRADYDTSEIENSVEPRRSPRLAEEYKRRAERAQAPAGALGHYYAGTELTEGRRTRYAISSEIKEKLFADISKLQEEGMSCHEIPGDIANLAKELSSRDDFLETATETISDPESGSQVTRPKFAAARIFPRDGAGPKVGAATPHGGIDSSRDDRGHLVAEKGVSDAQAIRVNGPDNVIPENWVINQIHKTAFEEGVKTFARTNPHLHVMTIHIPNYRTSDGEKDNFSSRPNDVKHMVAINGEVASVFTFNNSEHQILPRAY